ncbi:MAG: ferrous iron transport protein B [Bacillota bacterium]
MNHCCSNDPLGDILLDNTRGKKRIVLAGNPNSGKSVLFNALTGVYVDVSNYPGTTLEISHAQYGSDSILIDTPGVYGISSFNDEERIARDIILSADIVVNIINAVYLERDLFLTQQIIDTGVSVVAALNMIDEAEKRGLEIDIDALSNHLGIKVVPTVAVTKFGLEELKDSIPHAVPGKVTPGIKRELAPLTRDIGTQGDALLILEGDPAVAERHGMQPGEHQEEYYRARREHVNNILIKSVRHKASDASLAGKLSSLMMRPITGIPILVGALWLMYQIIGVFIAQHVVGFLEEFVMEGYYAPFIRTIVGQWVAQDSTVWNVLAGDFGILTMPVVYLIGLLMPLVIGFYFFLSLFEDSGYLPRIAALVDRVMNSVGLNGRAIIPMILGFGCVTMAIVVTRLLGSERERRIAIFLLGLAIPCSAQLGIIAGMLAVLGPKFLLIYILVIFTVLAVTGTLLNSLLPGKSSDLLIDLPPLRIPRADNVIKKTAVKSYSFLLEAAPLFVLGALIISVLQITGMLTALQNLIAPLTVGWLGLPKEAATAFIMGVIRRDFGAAGLASIPMADMQVLVALITLTLFVPCIAAIMVLFKERSKGEAALMWFGSVAIAFFVGGLVEKLSHISIGAISGSTAIITVFPVLGIAAVLLSLLIRSKRNNSTTQGSALS